MGDHPGSAVLPAAQGIAMAATGDVVQKAAEALFGELERQLLHNRKRTADLRHKHMLHYTAWAKRKLSALLAVLQWCNQENTGDFIAAVEAIKRENFHVQSRYNEILDAVFKLHSQLYSKLVRPLPVTHARDIIAHGTYPTLPKSIFTRGVMPAPEPLPEEEANPELTLAIQAKLLLLENWTAADCRVEFTAGLVVISKDYLFSLSLSVGGRAPTSAWEVMNYKILVTSAPDELLISDISKRGLEMRTLTKLDRIAKALDDKPALQTMLKLCEHAAQSALLNLLYCQSLSVSATSHAGVLEASFFQDVEGYRTILHLWPRDRNFTLGLTVSMGREVGSRLSGILFCPAASAGGTELFGLRDEQLRELDVAIVNNEWTTAHGLSVTRLMDFVTSIAVAQRAAALTKVLQQAASRELHKIVNIERTDTRLVISVGRASVTIEVSCMTGEYTAVPACGSFDDLGGFRGVLRRFVTEINELSASGRDHVGVVSMFGKLVSCLLLAHWAEVLAAMLQLQPHQNTGWSRLIFPASEQPAFTCQVDALNGLGGTTTFLLGVAVMDDFSTEFTAVCAYAEDAVLARPAVLYRTEVRRLVPLQEASDGLEHSEQFASTLAESLQQFPHLCARRVPERVLEADHEVVTVQVVAQKDGSGSITLLTSKTHDDRSVLVYSEPHAVVLLRTGSVEAEYHALASRIGDLENAAYVSLPNEGGRYVTDVSVEQTGMMWRVRGRYAAMAAATELRRRAKWLLRHSFEELQGHTTTGERIAGIPSITIQFQQLDCPFKQLTFVMLPSLDNEQKATNGKHQPVRLRLVLPDRSDVQYLRRPLEAVANDVLQLISSPHDLASVVDALGGILFMTAIMYAQSRKGVWRLQDTQLLSLQEQAFLVKIGSHKAAVQVTHTKYNDRPALVVINTITDDRRMLSPNAASTVQCLESITMVNGHAKAAAHGMDAHVMDQFSSP